ncbi:MAG: DUF3293 domain-containing protein [Gemmatimonadota bacterium]|nr:DUF3293 domain-containing protein [Gemmatimonadota bacterium]
MAEEVKSRALVDPSWTAYPHTVLTLGEDSGVRIDLRAPVTTPDRERLIRLGIRPPFAVITACNPNGRIVDTVENSRRTAALRSDLGLRGSPFVFAVGESPDGVHREPGIAVAMPLSAARRIAVAYDQSALFWYDGHAFWLIGALVESVPTRLPL